MKRIRVPTPDDAQALRTLRAEAESLEASLNRLNATSQQFMDTLAQLAEVQQALAAATQPLEAQAQALHTLAAAAQAAAQQATAATTQATAAAQQHTQAAELLAQQRLATEQTTGEAVVQASLQNAQRQMQALDELAARQQQQVDHERALNEARLDLSRAAQAAFADLNAAFGKGNQDFAAAQRALFAFSKALAVRDVVVATQREVAAVSAAYAAAPPVAAALTAKAIASGALRVATIVGQALPQLSGGGVLRGPTHAQGGIALVNRHTQQPLAEAEGGEVVLTRGVSRHPLLLALASHINQLAGGVRLQAHPQAVRLATGGVVPAPASTAQAPAPDAATQALLHRLDALANRPVVVSVAEINTVQNRVRVLEDAALL